MSGREKITPRDRRDIVLAVLYEGEPQIVLANQYGVDKGHVSRLVSDARETPTLKLQKAQEALEEAQREVRFRRRVIEVLRGAEPDVKRRKGETNE